MKLFLGCAASYSQCHQCPRMNAGLVCCMALTPVCIACVLSKQAAVRYLTLKLGLPQDAGGMILSEAAVKNISGVTVDAFDVTNSTYDFAWNGTQKGFESQAQARLAFLTALQNVSIVSRFASHSLLLWCARRCASSRRRRRVFPCCMHIELGYWCCKGCLQHWLNRCRTIARGAASLPGCACLTKFLFHRPNVQ